MQSGSESFDRLRALVARDAGLRADIERAYQALVNQVDVSDRGSRWVVGAVSEWILASAFYAAGAVLLPEGHDSDEVDLAEVLGEVRAAISVKSSFSRKSSDFRITNGLGGSGRGFVQPTVFLHPRLPGLVFADPNHHDIASEARVTGDAVTLLVTAVRRHAEAHPECVIEVKVPNNENRGTRDPGTPLAKELLQHFSILGRLFDDVDSKYQRTESTAGEIERLAKLKHKGEISQMQFDRAVERLIEPTTK